MREIDTIVDEIKQSVGLLRRHLDVDKARARLAELNKQAETQPLERPSAPSDVMQERTALDDRLASIPRIEHELDDQVMLIELGEIEKDKPCRRRRGRLKKLREEVARREMEALLSGEADANDC